MSTVQCEVDETVVVGSSVADADIMVTIPDAVSASDTFIVSAGPAVLIETVLATDTVTYDAYALEIGAIHAVDVAMPSVDLLTLITERVKVGDKASVITDTIVAATAAATAAAYYDVPILITESIAAASSVVPKTVATVVLSKDKVTVTDSLQQGSSYQVAEHIIAQATVVTALRIAAVQLSDTVAATNSVVATNTIGYLLFSTANATAVVPISGVPDQNILVSEIVCVRDTSFSANPNAKAWVMNTETGAASWYTNFDVQSMAQTPQSTLAAGPNGLYILDAQDDDGEPIQAEVEYGFNDFKSSATKRLDEIYIGYTSSGNVSVKCETFGDINDKGPQSFVSELRVATAPRNTRITPAKGLSSRYWRITVTNVDGAAFNILDTSADIAGSKRRI